MELVLIIFIFVFLESIIFGIVRFSVEGRHTLNSQGQDLHEVLLDGRSNGFITNSTMNPIEFKGPPPHDKELIPTIKQDKCATFGKSCIFQRDAVTPKFVEYVPCCRHLLCNGFGPNDNVNSNGFSQSSDFLVYRGVCTRNLDNGGGNLAKYKLAIGIPSTPDPIIDIPMLPPL